MVVTRIRIDELHQRAAQYARGGGGRAAGQRPEKKCADQPCDDQRNAGASERPSIAHRGGQRLSLFHGVRGFPSKGFNGAFVANACQLCVL